LSGSSGLARTFAPRLGGKLPRMLMASSSLPCQAGKGCCHWRGFPALPFLAAGPRRAHPPSRRHSRRLSPFHRGITLSPVTSVM
jgi:hypothetical protein